MYSYWLVLFNMLFCIKVFLKNLDLCVVRDFILFNVSKIFIKFLNFYFIL